MDIGDKFGEWTVIGKSDKPYYCKCQCSCGVIRDVYCSSLRNGKSLSCGHLREERERRYINEKYIGKRFGRLTPIKRLDKDGAIWFICKCDCGNTCEVNIECLRTGTTKSCGCIKSEVSRESMDKIKHLGVKALSDNKVDGTSLLALKQKTSKNSKTGVKGVCMTKDGRYRAYISIRRKHIGLGIFDTLEEAAEARRKGEEKYFKPIIDRYTE